MLKRPSTTPRKMRKGCGPHDMDILACGDVEQNPGPAAKDGWLKIVSLNVRSLRARKAEIEKAIEETAPDILCLQETHLTSDDAIHGWFEGYRAFRRDRTRPRRRNFPIKGGGLLTLVKEGINASGVERKEKKNDVTERLDVKIYPPGQKEILLVNIYLPPTSPSDPSDDRPSIDTYFNPNTLPTGDRTLIMGDFNAHHPLWDGRRKKEDLIGDKVAKWMIEKGMRPWNDKATPTLLNTRGSLSSPDLVISGPDMDSRSWTTLDSWGSDHIPMSIRIRTKYETGPTIKKFSFKKADWEGYRNHLEYTLRHLQRTGDPVRLNKQFTEAVKEAARLFIPRGGARGGKAWWTEELTQLVGRRNALKKEIMSDIGIPSIEQCERLGEISRQVQKQIDEGKKRAWADYMKELSQKKDLGHAFRTIKTLDGRKDKDPVAPLMAGGKLHTSAKQKADVLVEHYAKAFAPHLNKDTKKMLDGENRKSKVIKDLRDRVTCPGISMEELKHALRQLKKGKSPGPDGVYNEMLKHLGGTAMDTLLHLFNMSWEKGVVPSDWRFTHIIPLYKGKGKSRSDPASYRPISLTSNISKTMERIVKIRVDYHQDVGDVKRVHKMQSGFRKGRSTEENVLQVTTKLNRIRDDEFCGGLLLFDLKGAFDTVWHKGLNAKMRSNGYPQRITDWVAAFLDQRIAAVKVSGETGKHEHITGGVPQGTILAPTLFSIYMDDLSETFEKEGIDAVMYADDIAVVLHEKDLDSLNGKLMKILRVVESWCSRNSMVISKGKTEFLPVAGISYPQRTLKGKIRATFKTGEELEVVEKTKLLGVTFEEDMLFSEHSRDVLERGESRVRLLSCLAGTRWGCKKVVLRALYLTYVQPVFRYCLGVYGSFLPSGRNTPHEGIKKLQYRAAVKITGCIASSETFATLNEAGLWTLDALIEHDSLLLYESLMRKVDTAAYQATQPLEDLTRYEKLLPRRTWSDKQREASKAYKLPERTGTPHSGAVFMRRRAVAPWQRYEGQHVLSPFRDTQVKRTDPKEVRKEATTNTLNRLCEKHGRAFCMVFTDGSVKDGKNGGSAAILLHNGSDAAYGISGGLYSTSYKCELRALRLGIRLATRLSERKLASQGMVLICTDSQSVIRKMCQGHMSAASKDDFELWQEVASLTGRGHKLIVQYVPSHCGYKWNEKADQKAKEASERLAHTRETDIEVVKTLVRKHVIRSHLRLWKDTGVTKTYREQFAGSYEKFEELDRKKEVAIMRLRVGKSPLTCGYLLIPPVEEVPCHLCSQPQTLSHLLRECQDGKRIDQRSQIFGSSLPSLKVLLSTDACKTAQLLERQGTL
eukprot:TRINITY_DN943_c0_g1_i12.p1 TRINITY_DN943_c0_g1~~TRINITY_DN943_c0_g1_i12.p1  ORF type:complete len:1328 (+),score=253.65 TRINITY_DN943_c0_g1_i12:2183-6166(+)